METKVDYQFQCFVCLDLIYKPVVLECGHISCFWCVHKSMCGYHGSNCAICRKSYNFFPAICELLHHIIKKLEPTAYREREIEVLEEETKAGCFSPQFIRTEVDVNQEKGSSLVHCKTSEETGVTISDFICSECKNLLFRPAVLNCGHVFCELCVCGIACENTKCPTCGDLHPGDLPNVCLDLDQFIERQFPVEYGKRRDHSAGLIKTQSGSSTSSACPTSRHLQKNMTQEQVSSGFVLVNNEYLNAHVGVGCDACGMYPIVGKRYKCIDCKEAIGFDLCEACYGTPSKRPGRFNQQHTPDHKFVLDDFMLLRNVQDRFTYELSERNQVDGDA